MGSGDPSYDVEQKRVFRPPSSSLLGITYKTAWFMCPRIREAMSDPKPHPLGGEGKVIGSPVSLFPG
jgi:hypothetical protein